MAAHTHTHTHTHTQTRRGWGFGRGWVISRVIALTTTACFPPSLPIHLDLFTHSQPSWYQSTTFSSYCGWTLIYWAFGISETQLPKTSCPRNGNGRHLFYSKSFLVWSFDASTGNLIFFLASGHETLNDCCSGQTVDRRGGCALPD